MAMKILLYQNNSQTVTITGVSDLASGNPITGATVTCTLVGSTGATVDPAIINLPMTDVVGAPGSYSGQVADTFNPLVGSYTLQITGTKSGTEFYIEQPVSVKVRSV